MPRLVVSRRGRGLPGFVVLVITRRGTQGRTVICDALPAVWRVTEHHYDGHAYRAPGCPECERRRQGGER